jgi:hypothetical protein
MTARRQVRRAAPAYDSGLSGIPIMSNEEGCAIDVGRDPSLNHHHTVRHCGAVQHRILQQDDRVDDSAVGRERGTGAR